MKIGVDAGALSIRDNRLKVGVYRVTYNLLRQLGALDKDNIYYLYSFTRIDQQLMDAFGPRMIDKVLHPTVGWFSVRLPLEMQVHPVDVFLGLSQALPKTTAHKIGFVYDIGFLHTPKSYPGSYEKLKKQTADLVARSDRIVTISHAVSDDLKKRYHVDESKITVAYPGVDSAFSHRGKRFVGKKPYFLFVGALKPGKNVPTILRAFALFCKMQKKPYDLFLIGGDFWRDREIDETIARYHLEHSVRQLGFVPDSELATYYRGATALVSPSLHEGFCLPVVEAFASGCPVIGSTASAMPEIIGNAGLLVDPHSMDEIAGAMEQLASDENLRTTFSQKGIIRSRAYSWKKFGEAVLRTIRDGSKN